MDVNNVINYLNLSNTKVKETLIDGFINDTTIKYFPLYVLETFAINKEAQSIIMSLDEIHLKHLSKIIKYAESVNQDWIPLCASYYHFLKNKRYTNLVDELCKNELEQSQIENLLFVISNGGNYYEVNSIEDLYNIPGIRNDKNNKNSETMDPNILLLNKYGISYDKAYNIYSRYGKDIESLPESDEKELLIDIKNILEGKGTKKTVFGNIKFIVNIDSILRNFYSQIYDESFLKPSDDKQISVIDGIKIYNAGLDFNMCVYSYGMATTYEKPYDFKKAWNRPSISTDYMCNSIISSSSLKTHVKHCLFGFDHFGSNNLSLLGSNDLGTGGIYNDINITNPFHQKKLIADVEFRTPKGLINNTRFTNNEVYRSRRRVVNGKLERINPDYIVYLKIKENINEDIIWSESLQAAKDFNIPIVVVDCEQCLLNNIEKVEQKINIFESRYDDSKILKSILEDIYTINSGYWDVASNLLNNYLGRERIISYLSRIITHIDEISTNAPNTALECINIVINTLNDEFNKVLKSPYWVEVARQKGHTVEKPEEIINIFLDKKRQIEMANADIKKTHQTLD